MALSYTPVQTSSCSLPCCGRRARGPRDGSAISGSDDGREGALTVPPAPRSMQPTDINTLHEQRAWHGTCYTTSGMTSTNAQRVLREYRPPSLRRRVRSLEALVASLTRENRILRSLAQVDPLTLVANRRGFDAELGRLLSLCTRQRRSMAVLVADVDGLKPLNDHGGHAAGDEALRLVAQILRGSVRASDVVARVGGDEFAVLLPATDAVGAQHVAERIRAGIESAPWPQGTPLTVSIGFAARGPRGGETGVELITQADRALYAAKRAGKNRVVGAS
jgi:diguanylate cyclase (GGDEF)-like protein